MTLGSVRQHMAWLEAMSVMSDTRVKTTQGSVVWRFSWRFAACLAVVLAATQRWGQALADSLLPLVAAEIEGLDNTYRIVSLALVDRGGEQLIRIVVTLARCVVLPDGAHCGDPRAQAQVSTLLGHLTLPPALTVAAVLAWPLASWREAACRLPLLGLAVVGVLALDVPMVLWASLWQLHVDAFAPGLFSPLLMWLDFLQGGGRMALALLAAAGVVAVARLAAGAGR